MSMRYKLPAEVVKTYYNVVGVEFDVSEDKPYVETRDLEEISPFKNGLVLPSSSRAIDREFQNILHKLCEEFGDSEEAESLKSAYYVSLLGILNTVTSLNVLAPYNKNYVLAFVRLNSILLPVLREINRLTTEEVIDFYNLIVGGEFQKVLSLMGDVPCLSIFTFLAMNPDSDFPDYRMFKKNLLAEIDYYRLVELLGKNTYKSTDFEPFDTSFNRMSYDKSFEMTPKKEK